ncbi:MAG: L,D-transpeptidase [Acidimicrobiales bacterium]|jgi:peptidoglycan hydrolase-like protein with peptidoglycan-binding domain
MGQRNKPRAFDKGGPWRVPGLVTGLILIVALGVAGTLIALQRAHLDAAQGGPPPAHPTTTVPIPPLTITSVSPAPGTADAAFDTSVTVDFSQPLASNSPLPTLSPSPPGNWVRTSPVAVRFVPDGYFTPYTTVQLSVPGGPGGVRSSLGQGLTDTLRKKFEIEGGSELRLQQLLAELGYLPVEFVPEISASVVPTGVPISPQDIHQAASLHQPVQSTAQPRVSALDAEPSDPTKIPLQAVPGSFVWRYDNVPAPLRALWTPGQPNVMMRGAIMAFESAHGLATDGMAGPKAWAALLLAVAQREVTNQPYDYVVVNEASPETASVWRDGKIIFTTPVNTGIPAAPTATGTYPVYARYVVTTMSGKNPNGTPYSDPGIPWVSYFNGGDALHGFIRASYGFPQSLGCVEMTYANAAIMWPLTPLGTLVTVQ